MENNRYVVTLRAAFNAEDDEVARLYADKIREDAAEDLDDDDTVDVVQITRFSAAIAHEEAIQRLKQARNLLLRSRLQGSYDTAREMDMFIHAMQLNSERAMADGTYDYGKFMEIAEAIMVRKEFPND